MHNTFLDDHFLIFHLQKNLKKYRTILRCTQVYLQQQLRRWIGCSHSRGYSGTDSVQLLDLPAPDLVQTWAVPLHPNSAGPWTVHTKGQLRPLCQQPATTWKEASSRRKKNTNLGIITFPQLPVEQMWRLEGIIELELIHTWKGVLTRPLWQHTHG